MPESTKVVDSWAMVAWVQDEAAAPAVEAFLQEADSGAVELCMSWMNVAETFYILAKRDSPAVAEEFLARLPSLPIRTVLPGEEGMVAARGSKPRIRSPSATPLRFPWLRLNTPASLPAMTKSGAAEWFRWIGWALRRVGSSFSKAGSFTSPAGRAGAGSRGS